MPDKVIGPLEFINGQSQVTITINGEDATVKVGGEGSDGRLNVRDSAGREVFRFTSADARLLLGGEDKPGDLRILDFKGREWFIVAAIALGAVAIVGTKGMGGNVFVRHFDGTDTVRLSSTGEVSVGAKDHPGKITVFGGEGPLEGQNGRLMVQDNEGRNAFQVSGGQVRVGVDGKAGDLRIIDQQGRECFVISTLLGAVAIMGTKGLPGNLSIRNQDGSDTFNFAAGSAHLRVGNTGHAGTIDVLDSNANARVRILGETGDIELQGADCAEEFELLEEALAEPATVMVIDADGKLRPCDEAYDRKVAGVISGAGALSPGITLDKQGGEGRSPVALAGKVFCKVDARYAPIEVGDLLTTSPTIGHAMKATDHARAFGAVIGKALKPLKASKGFIPILIALQ